MQYIKRSAFIRLLLLLGIVIYPFRSIAQEQLSGCYRVYSNSICINPDSTFQHQWKFDMIHEWASGKWSVKNDTLYFKMEPVYDTLIYADEHGIKITKVILSEDEKSERITIPLSNYPSIPYQWYEQNNHYLPKKLFFRDGKLFEIKPNGKLIKKKIRGFWTREKHVPWYVKVKETEDGTEN